jgi:pyruvate,water dikinase
MLMLRMAGVVKCSPPAFAALTDGRPEALGRAANACPQLAALLGELLDRYGDRCMGELKLESRSLRDDSSFVAAMLINYLRSNGHNAITLARKAREERADVEGDVLRRAGVLTRMRLRRALRSARTAIRAREEMRLARARLFGVHRQVYRAIGVRLHEHGGLDDASDVFYLTVEEIADAGPSTNRLAAIARARRATFAGFAETAPPNRIITASVPDPFARVDLGRASTARVAAGRVLCGLGCSAGIAEGRVRIVTGPDDDLSIDGHVLVATRTDPGWSPLFHAAAAIVVERGSVLSHSAVLARELGLPAVVGVPGLLTTLRNGERVRVDGAAGTVERLDVP